MSQTRQRLASVLLRTSLLAGCAVATFPTHAQEEPLATDRPDFVESSDVVGAGRIQVETSVAFERNRVDGNREKLRATPTLLRIGIGDTLEARIESDGFLRSRSSDEAGMTVSERGLADVSLGLKWHMQDGDATTGRPGMGWLVHIDTDSGSPEFRGKDWRPSLRMVAEWELPGGHSLGVMPGVFVEHDEAGSRYVGGIAAVVLGKSFTDRMRGFIEVSGQQLTSRRHGGNVVTGDVGVAYLLTNSVQIDTAASWGLSQAAPDFGWTVGLSIRF